MAVCHFAKDAAPVPSPKGHKGDKVLKDIFLEVKSKFGSAISVFRQEKITIDPDDPAAVQRYADVMKMAKEKAGIMSEAQKAKHIIETRTQGIPDVRTYLEALQEIRIKRGLTDDIGIEAMMFEALETVEKEIKKPLMRNDKKGMARLTAEYDKGLELTKRICPKLRRTWTLKLQKLSCRV